jgi:hypothetical protein
VPRRDDLGWLEEEEAEREGGVSELSPVDVLREVARDPKATASARVQAAQLLLARGVDMEGEVETPEVFTAMLEMSDEELDKELAGFFNPGWQEPPRDIDREVEMRTRKAIKRWAKTQARTPEREPQEEPASEPADEVDPDSEEGKTRRALAQRLVREKRAQVAAARANGARS